MPRIRNQFNTILLYHLGTLATDTTGQLDILGHDGNTLGVDGTQVGILKESHEVRLGCLLKGKDGGGLETQVRLEILGDLTDQTLEGQLADQQVGRLLVTTNLTKSDGTGAVTCLLYTSPSPRDGATSRMPSSA